MMVGIAVETTVDSKEARAVTRTSANVTARTRPGAKRAPGAGGEPTGGGPAAGAGSAVTVGWPLEVRAQHNRPPCGRGGNEAGRSTRARRDRLARAFGLGGAGG